MSDKTFRPITDLEIVEQMSENDTVLIERNGMLKRTKGVSQDAVKSVNGVIPDSEGNVELPTTIPSIRTATVGQSVVVKAVDENGKPTEWEAADAGQGIVWLTRNSYGEIFIKDGGGAALSTEEFADLFNKNVLRLDMSDEDGSYINTITGYAFTYSGNYVYVGNDTYNGDFD